MYVVPSSSSACRNSCAPSRVAALETRRLHALTREKAVDRITMHTENATDTDRVEPAVVNQPADRLRMDAELIGDVPNADEVVRLMIRSRHCVQNYNRSRPI